MNYREQFYEGEIDGKSLLDVIDEKEAEAQALREELKNECKIAAFWNEQAEKYKAEAEALRARVVVTPDLGWFRAHIGEALLPNNRENAIDECAFKIIDELARLNGKAVSEGLLRRVCAMSRVGEHIQPDRLRAMFELSALLEEGKEHE